jgi:hypothetical protein
MNFFSTAKKTANDANAANDTTVDDNNITLVPDIENQAESVIGEPKSKSKGKSKSIPKKFASLADKPAKKPADEKNPPDDARSDTTNTKPVEWSPENEMIMVEWCDQAQCYKWLNSRSHAKYAFQNAWFTIPAITLSTISGTASFAQASLPLDYQAYAPMVIGSINIFIGILTTIQQYLKIAELNEAHRVAAIAWDKFARNIRIELAKDPSERMDAGHFLKLSRQEFDRLMETSPAIPINIVAIFKSTFESNPDYAELFKPDICDILVTANKSRHHWYLEIGKELNKSSDKDDDDRGSADLLRNAAMLNIPSLIFKEKEEALKKREMVLNLKEAATIQKEREEKEKIARRQELQSKFAAAASAAGAKVKEQNKKIDDYISMFYNTYGRRPLTEEIADHFKTENIDTSVMANYLKKYTLMDGLNII